MAKTPKKPKKPRRLTRVRVSELSIVDNPAVKRARFVLVKREAPMSDEPQEVQVDETELLTKAAEVLNELQDLTSLPERLTEQLTEALAKHAESEEIEKASRVLAPKQFGELQQVASLLDQAATLLRSSLGGAKRITKSDEGVVISPDIDDWDVDVEAVEGQRLPHYLSKRLEDFDGEPEEWIVAFAKGESAEPLTAKQLHAAAEQLRLPSRRLLVLSKQDAEARKEPETPEEPAPQLSIFDEAGEVLTKRNQQAESEKTDAAMTALETLTKHAARLVERVETIDKDFRRAKGEVVEA